MQEQNEQKRAKLFSVLGKMELVCLGVCLLVLLTLAAGGIYLHKDIPMANRGESHTKFPWYGVGVVIDEVEVHWQNSEKSGSPYLQSHVGYHPVVKIRLADDCKGSGTLAIEVTDGELNSQNKATRLAYRDGEFVTRVRANKNDLEEASGKEATVYIPCGMGKTSDDIKDFRYHLTMRDRRLWRVYISNRPQDGDGGYTDMGYTTIPATGDDL